MSFTVNGLNSFPDTLRADALRDHTAQKTLAITLFVVSVIAFITSCMGIGYCAKLSSRIFPVFFTATLISSCIIGASVFFKDWNAYHEEAFYNQFKRDCKDYERDEEFKIFLGKYDFAKLHAYSYISGELSRTIKDIKNEDLKNPEILTHQRERWNQFIRPLASS